MSEAVPALLCVDDEANILSSLRRLFRPLGYKVLTAESATKGLEVMAQERIDLVISDMRMPEMDGARFLEKVKQHWPDTIRILLTGHADVASTVAAINQGEIYRYISKPWDDNEVLVLVRHALDRHRLEQENKRLEALTQAQNEQLKTLNAGLEQQVRERTEQLRQTLSSLESAHQSLKKGFLTSIRVFSSLIELRGGSLAGHSRRVAEHARAIAQQIGLAPAEVQDVMFASLLHDIGKIGLPDAMLLKPHNALSEAERREVIKHPVKGQTALMALEQLSNAATLIRSHHERFDGKGFPDGLSGADIPLGARILAAANDYDALLHGTLTGRCLPAADALSFMREASGKRYDPQVVDAVEVALAGRNQQVPSSGTAVGLDRLEVGMVLTRELHSRDGILLVARDRVVDARLVAQLKAYAEASSEKLVLEVRPKDG